MKAFSAQMTDFYWVWSQRPLYCPRFVSLDEFGVGAHPSDRQRLKVEVGTYMPNTAQKDVPNKAK